MCLCCRRLGRGECVGVLAVGEWNVMVVGLLPSLALMMCLVLALGFLGILLEMWRDCGASEVSSCCTMPLLAWISPKDLPPAFVARQSCTLSHLHNCNFHFPRGVLYSQVQYLLFFPNVIDTAFQE